MFLLFGLTAFIAFAAASRPADEYDYIIIGGGTCGLVLANRLSANPNTSVAVIEAGDSVYNNPNVTQIQNYFQSLGSSIDWQYPIQPSPFTNNRTLVYHQGKALGGTSTINGATYVRAQKAQIDAWKAMGNDGWDWDTLWPYYLKSENFQVPTPDLVAKGAAYNPSFHAQGGPVSVGWGNNTVGGDVHNIVNQTWQAFVPYSKDQSGGDVHGFSVWPSTIDARQNIRADAARNYYWPVAANRRNLRVFSNTLAEKIFWNKHSDHLPVAAGVQIRPIAGGACRQLKAKREVIVSAGSLRSPALLELSGVGNPRILAQYNIPVKVALPAVGENLQDQPNVIIQANTTHNITSWDGYPPYITNINASESFGDDLPRIAADLDREIPHYAAQIARGSNGAVSAAVVEKQLRMQTDLMFSKGVPLAEILTFPQPTMVLVAFWNLLPFSRGNVHIRSSDAGVVPDINPNFYMLDWDEIVGAATANLIRKLFRTPPLSTSIGPDVLPDNMTVPHGAGPNGWSSFLRSTCTPNSHPVGTCAMMSRQLGGVVDSNLKVYGTRNVRVVDASILPFQIDGHLTSTLYAVSERAADLILGSLDNVGLQ